jgi:hypothetical protein
VDVVPEVVEAMDGIGSEEEAHNVERPARRALKKKGPKGKPLSEFNEGDVLQAKVKTLTSYGAFLDIGAQVRTPEVLAKQTKSILLLIAYSFVLLYITD